ncbi:MAG: hypothetical protein QW266_03280 [Sulfolobales archaeon]
MGSSKVRKGFLGVPGIPLYIKLLNKPPSRRKEKSLQSRRIVS